MSQPGHDVTTGGSDLVDFNLYLLFISPHCRDVFLTIEQADDGESPNAAEIIHFL